MSDTSGGKLKDQCFTLHKLFPWIGVFARRLCNINRGRVVDKFRSTNHTRLYLWLLTLGFHHQGLVTPYRLVRALLMKMFFFR